MPNPTAIANDALSLLGDDALSSYNEVTALGATVRRHYKAAKLALFEAFPYHFTEKRKVLAEVPTGSDDPYWLYAFEKPTDCLSVRRIMNSTLVSSEGSLPFSMAEQVIYCDTEAVAAWYTSSAIDEGDWSNAFADFMAAEVALRLGPARRASETTIRRVMLAHQSRKALAQAQSFNQRQFRPLDGASSFESARDG